ncbi:outer membrane protein [Leptospira ryugenii]|uniref:Outer membrane protein n=2 Tax=Leptospira ryugenii TaxID=1917863 RepID=A0A2P2DZN0_9LEPT|nr:outer membrane protein [Leptospira ryugenii]
MQTEAKKENSISPSSLKFGAYIDTYYLQNLNRPVVKEREFTTQAVRNQEFNVNMAHVEAKLEEEKYRGRLALHWGTSVVANTASEVNSDRYSNQLSTRNIQEAFAGVKVGKETWLDMGVFFGNIGYESWISQNNINYTRAFALDYVPYYSSGIRLSHRFNQKWSGQLQILNGWQNITETNKDKAFGSQILFKIFPNVTLTLNQFVGNEAPNTERKQIRLYNNTILEWHISEHWLIALQADIGAQRAGERFAYEPWWRAYDPSLSETREERSLAFRQWYHGTLWLSYKISSDYRLSFRVERFYDPKQVLAVSNSPNGFIAYGYTTTFDILSFEPALLRFEYVYRRSMDSIFPYRDAKTSAKEDFFIFAFSLRL